MTETKRLVLVAKVTDIAGSEAGPNLTFSTVQPTGGCGYLARGITVKL